MQRDGSLCPVVVHLVHVTRGREASYLSDDADRTVAANQPLSRNRYRVSCAVP
jgi:hypothetical protein